MTKCHDCEREYGDEHGFPDLVVPHDVWKIISPSGDEGGLLCPSCMCKRAHVAGLTNIPTLFRSGPFKVRDERQSWRLVLESLKRDLRDLDEQRGLVWAAIEALETVAKGRKNK